MSYSDLSEFLAALTSRGLLKRVSQAVSPYLQMTEICDRTLRAKGPALLFERPKGHHIPVLGNLFGTTQRIALALGFEDPAKLREVGEVLAYLQSPQPPESFKEAWEKVPLLKQVFHMKSKVIATRKAPCFSNHFTGSQVRLGDLPIQTCWPGDAGPLITWGLVITRGPEKARQNIGIYRLQVIDQNRVIMRWLAHRGGALDYAAHCLRYPDKPFPVSVALGPDPATLLAAVTPIPDHLSEYAFAGLLRGGKTQVCPGLYNDLQLPAHSQMVLEGHIMPGDVAEEGPFGDHTGYYNEVSTFPVMTIEALSMTDTPIYHSTYTGKPPDEPAVLGVAFNEIFIPLLQRQYPEIVDFYLPPEACSYRMAMVSIRKQYPGHASRIMMGVWSFLRQFLYTKWIVVVDEDIDVRDHQAILWALSTRVDPRRDMHFLDNSPIDYLDFASPHSGLGSKIGIDATSKGPPETTRAWGEPIVRDPKTTAEIDALWETLAIFD